MLSLCEEYRNVFNFGAPFCLDVHFLSLPILVQLHCPQHTQGLLFCCHGSQCLQLLAGPTALSPVLGSAASSCEESIKYPLARGQHFGALAQQCWDYDGQ